MQHLQATRQGAVLLLLALLRSAEELNLDKRSEPSHPAFGRLRSIRGNLVVNFQVPPTSERTPKIRYSRSKKGNARITMINDLVWVIQG